MVRAPINPEDHTKNAWIYIMQDTGCAPDPWILDTTAVHLGIKKGPSFDVKCTCLWHGTPRFNKSYTIVDSGPSMGPYIPFEALISDKLVTKPVTTILPDGNLLPILTLR